MSIAKSDATGMARRAATISRPLCGRWRSFAASYADVGNRPTWRPLPIRDDPIGEFAPGKPDGE
jgi:hypothetical protein